MSRDWRLYAQDIREKIRYIKTAFSGLHDISDYLADESIKLSVERAFEIIGDAAKHFNHIPWKAIIGMRDQIAHGDHGIDDELIWHTAQHELEALNAAVNEMLQ